MSSSSRSSSVNRWSEYQRTKGSQTDGLTNNERLPILNRSSSSSGGHLSINSMDSLEGSLSVMKFDDQNSNSASSLAFNFVKYHCKDCIASCKIHRGVSCKNMFYDRFPKGCAVMVVLLINMLESFAIYGAFRGLQERIMGISTTGRPIFGYIFVFFQWCAGRMFYPITGLIADTCLGRYRTIRIGFWLMWIAFVLISIGEVLEYANIGSKAAESYVLPIVAVVLLIISSASVEANIIPFGVDQIQQGAPSSEISSYFYCYYFSARAGSLLSVCVFLALVGTHKSLVPDSNLDPVNGCGFTCQTFLAVHPLFAVFSVTLALILHVLAQNKYFRDRDYSNPLRLIINVLYYAATVKRRVSRYRRAFRYGEERKPRIELAKEEFDGIFTSEEVEDVKTFFQISLVTFSLSGNCFTYGMTVNILQKQVSDASAVVFGAEETFLSSVFFDLQYLFLVLISILMMTHLILPLFPGFRMKLKIGMGVLFTALSPAVAIIIQFVVGTDSSHSLAHLLWLIVPTVFLAFGHTNFFTAGLEFIYAQSPNSMKGLLTGIFFLWYGVSIGLGIIYFGIFPLDDNIDQVQIPTIGVYYAIATFVGVVSIAMYSVAACIYRNRVRPSSTNEIEDDAVRRGLYGQVSTLNFPFGAMSFKNAT